MKKIAAILVTAVFLLGSGLSFAADVKAADTKPAKKTIFNSLSDFFSTFDRPFTRPGNKQGIWNATADWMRNINKE